MPSLPKLDALPGCLRWRLAGVWLVLLLGWNNAQAGPVGLSPQLIPLPVTASAPLFADVEGKGRCELFVINQAEKTLLVYQQHEAGYSHSPDQVIALPAQTAWAALGDVDPHPGLELLFSTATGVSYFRQDAGQFEAESHLLIATSQVFTNCDELFLISLTTNTIGTNVTIPIITSGQTVLYHRNRAYEWSPGVPVSLDAPKTTWSVTRDSWAMGSTRAHSLRVQQSFRAKPKQTSGKDPGYEAVEKIAVDMGKNALASPVHTDFMDVNGDGREDVLLWQVSGKMDFKTDVYIFLRDADQHLPPQPSQVLHCHGLPISGGSLEEWTPVHDLKGDGGGELVLLEFNTTILSADGALKTALAHGLEWSLTIRTFQHGTFSRNPGAAVPVTMTLPAEVLSSWTIFTAGDFNGDGRPDLLVRRSDNQWNVFFSTTDGRWFAPPPALTFDSPANGHLEVKDLNGDGLSDIIWHDLYHHTLSIFMSPVSPPTGKNP